MAVAAPLALWLVGGRNEVGAQESRVSGAYRALSFWGDSRAYPNRKFPDGAYTAGWELAKTKLRGAQAAGATRTVAPAGPQSSLRLQPQQRWKPVGPTNGGGRTLTLAFDPVDANTIYAGAASGGLWKSTTGGVGADAWERIDTGHPVLGVSTIAFEPGNPQVIYIGTGEVYNFEASGDLEADRRTRGSYGVGILKTTDGGASWSKSLDWSYNQQHGVWAVRVDPLDPQVVWAATTEGVYKSLDAGGSWSLSLGVAMATDLVVHPTDPDVVLAGCGNLGSAGRGLYRTTNGGGNWTQVTGGGVPSDYQGKVQFGVTAADDDVVYASIGNGYEVNGPNNFTWLLRSDDFGASFTLQGTNDYSRWQGWFAHDVAVHPSDPNTVLCIGIDVWKSTNAGVTQVQKSNYALYYSGELPDGGPEGPPTYPHADHHDVVYHPTVPNLVYFANDGGVYRSTDGGETFAAANGGYQTTQFYNGSWASPTDPDLFMGGLQDNASAIHRSGGAWSRFVLGGDGGWCAIRPDDEDVVYATAQFLFVGRSIDGGQSWVLVSPPDQGGPVAFIAPFVMSPTDPDVLYAGSNYLFKSFDGGDQWFVGQGGTEIDGNPILQIAVAPQDDDVVYLATSPFAARGRVHRTLDGGSTFDEITGSLPDRYPGDLAVDPTNAGTVYIAISGFGSSHLFRSTNHGAAWTDIDGGQLPDVPATAIAIDPQNPEHVYLGNDLGVFRTTDGGTTWVQLFAGLSEAVLVNELHVSMPARKLRAMTHGRGVFEWELP